MAIDRILFPECHALRKELTRICEKTEQVEWGESKANIDVPGVSSTVWIRKPVTGCCTRQELRFRLGRDTKALKYATLVDEIGEATWDESSRPVLRVDSVLADNSFQAVYNEDGYGFCIQLEMQDQDSVEAEYSWSLSKPAAHSPSYETELDHILTTLPAKVMAIVYCFADGNPNVAVSRSDIVRVLKDELRVLSPEIDLQPGKINSDKIVHNGGRQANAALQLTEKGVSFIQQTMGSHASRINQIFTAYKVTRGVRTPPREEGASKKRERTEEDEVSAGGSKPAGGSKQAGKQAAPVNEAAITFDNVLHFLHGPYYRTRTTPICLQPHLPTAPFAYSHICLQPHLATATFALSIIRCGAFSRPVRGIIRIQCRR